MIFQSILERKDLFSGLINRFLFFLVIIIILTCSLQAGDTDTITIELGKEGETVTQKVETLNLEKYKAGTFWNQTVKPMLIPPMKPQNIPLNKIILPDLKIERPELYTPAEKVDAEPTRITNTPLKKVIDGPLPSPVAVVTPPPTVTLPPTGAGPIAISGPGNDSRIAISDGSVTINPYLSTYNQAHYIVRLIDVNGNEIKFNGKPLFSWNRSDSTTYKPLYFKGVKDNNSMFKKGPGDYSPTKNLSYNFPVKQGQKIVVDYAGNPTNDAFMKLNSSSF